MKTKHQQIRLDAETNAIVQKYQAQFGTSASETILRLIQAAEGKTFVSILTTTLSRSEELSFFAGQLEKTRLLWREIKSRLNAPRPLDPDDAAAIKQWRDDRVKIQKFYDDCEGLWQHSHSLSSVLTGTTPEDLLKMRRAATLLKAWSEECTQTAEDSKDPEEMQKNLQSKQDCDTILAVLRRIGINAS